MADEQEISKADVDPEAANEAADKAAEAAKETTGDEAEQPERDDSVAGEMAALTHEQVRESAPFQGLLNETRELREENKRLKEAAKPAETDTAGADDEEDVFTRGDVRREAEAIAEKKVAALRKELGESNTAARQEAYQRGLDALRADQIAGKIPMGVSTDALMKQAVAAMKDSDPEILQSLMGKPNAVRKIWNYAKVTLPAIAQALDKAGTVEMAAEKERIALGGSPEGAEPSTNMEAFVDALKPE